MSAVFALETVMQLPMGGGGSVQFAQFRKIAKSINFESIMKGIKIAEVLKTRMTNLKSSMSAEIRY